MKEMEVVINGQKVTINVSESDFEKLAKASVNNNEAQDVNSNEARKMKLFKAKNASLTKEQRLNDFIVSSKDEETTNVSIESKQKELDLNEARYIDATRALYSLESMKPVLNSEIAYEEAKRSNLNTDEVEKLKSSAEKAFEEVSKKEIAEVNNEFITLNSVRNAYKTNMSTIKAELIKLEGQKELSAKKEYKRLVKKQANLNELLDEFLSDHPAYNSDLSHDEKLVLAGGLVATYPEISKLITKLMETNKQVAIAYDKIKPLPERVDSINAKIDELALKNELVKDFEDALETMIEEDSALVRAGKNVKYSAADYEKVHADIKEAKQLFIDSEIEKAEKTGRDSEITRLLAERDELKAEIKNKNKVINRLKTIGAIVLIGGAILIGTKGCENKEAIVTETTVEENLEDNYVLPGYLSFNPNSNSELVSRVTNVIANAYRGGINDIAVKDWFNYYLVANIDYLEPQDLAQLNSTGISYAELMRSYDLVNNKLSDDSITSTTDTNIDLSALFADEQTASVVKDFQMKIAKFNEASKDEKEALGSELNQFIKDFYMTNEFKDIDPAANVTILNLIRGTEKLTVNTDFRVPSKDMSNILYGENAEAIICDEDLLFTIYGAEKSEVKILVTDMVEEMNAKTAEATYAETETEKELQDKIAENIIAMNPEFKANPDLNVAIDALREEVVPVFVNPKTGEETKAVVEPITKEDIAKIEVVEINGVETPAIVEEKPTVIEQEEAKQDIQAEIDAANKAADEELAGATAAAQIYMDKGVADALAGKEKNIVFPDFSGKSEAYIKGYKGAATNAYNIGYDEAKKNMPKETGMLDEINGKSLVKTLNFGLKA